jgi:asparagine synthase (glutamine-hydrolysing)
VYSYVALVWNPLNPLAVSYAARLCRKLRDSPRPWTEVFNVNGASIFTSAPKGAGLKTYELPGEAGMVLGHLFPTDSASWSPLWQPDFRSLRLSRLYDESDDSFSRNFWGGYIGLFRNSAGTQTRVLRDCSGKVPCYRMEQDAVHLFFSDVSTLCSENIRQFDIDWSSLAAFIYSRDAQIRKTPLRGITELLAGDAFEVHEHSARQYSAWDPRKVVAARTIDDYEEAKRLVRSATQYSVDAWASLYESITLRLSGGFDSAVVLGSLKHSPKRPAVMCTHEFSDHPYDDERAYARLAAKTANTALIELPRPPDGELFDAALTRGQDLPRPSIQALFGSSGLKTLRTIAANACAQSAWTGQGGDHLFFQAHTSLGAADYISHHGIKSGFFSAVSDSARLSREPYFLVARSAWKLGRSHAPWNSTGMRDSHNRNAPFLNPDSLPGDLAPYLAHPWTTQAESIPKGKQFQISILADVLNRHRPTPTNEPVGEHHPLLSQPLIETCLQIPTYQLLRGGRQRALARDAFADRVPIEILQREDKGTTTIYVTDTLRRSESFVRELLMDGYLSRYRLIGRNELEPYIVQGQSIQVEHFWPLLACVAAELWVRRWVA